MNHARFSLLILLTGIYVVPLGGCLLPERLSNIGDPPEISMIQNPELVDGYKPVSMPMPSVDELSGSQPHVNSLWQNGSRAFFKDQRASRVGDVITVDIKFSNKATVDDKLDVSRTNTQSTPINNLFGYEKYAKKVFPNAVTPKSFTNLGSDTDLKTKGSRESTDEMDIKIAATIIQILPNGNMVIQGRREMRISAEVRTIELKGIIRREDIVAGNRIKYAKIAEARLSDVSKGEISDLNTTPWGQEILNKILPF